MFKKTRFFALAALTALIAVPPANADPRVEFIGFTKQSVLPDIGIYGLGDICRQEFGESRMCVSNEIVETFNPPTSVPSFALGWVQPVLTGLTQGNNVNEFLAIETYGGELARTPSGSLSCSSWQSSSERTEGLILRYLSPAEGSFARLNCSLPAPVACCKLVAEK